MTDADRWREHAAPRFPRTTQVARVFLEAEVPQDERVLIVLPTFWDSRVNYSDLLQNHIPAYVRSTQSAALSVSVFAQDERPDLRVEELHSALLKLSRGGRLSPDELETISCERGVIHVEAVEAFQRYQAWKLERHGTGSDDLEVLEDIEGAKRLVPLMERISLAVREIVEVLEQEKEQNRGKEL